MEPLVGTESGLEGESSDAAVSCRPVDEIGAGAWDHGAWPDAANAMPEDITATTPPVATNAWTPRRVERAVAISSPLVVVWAR